MRDGNSASMNRVFVGFAVLVAELGARVIRMRA